MVERTVGDYKSPVIHSLKGRRTHNCETMEERCNCEELGRRNGYKALETRLNHLGAKRGVLNIVDLWQEYYIVTFTCEKDQSMVLLEGLGLIYDHYLTVREFISNFCLNTYAIDQLAVWVRISKLPIEYYDHRVLSFVENHISKTIEVNKTNLSRERGKYARLCV